MKIDSLPIPIRCFAYTVITSGIIHLTIIHIAAFTGDWQQLNYFHVLGFDLIWPELGKGTSNLLFSQLFCLLPVIWFWYFTRQKKLEQKSE